ncbi:MAG: hypothetical protein ABJA66_15525 [Actinomycetota bacterium]
MTGKISLQINNEEIVFADLTNREILEAIIICKSGNIFLYDIETNSKTLFTQLSFNPYQLNLQIYSFQNYVCIVQKNGTLGMVIDLSNPNFQKLLKRGDYCVEHCLFPIAFYSNENQTFLIHGSDWNRLDITCLENDELLTNRIVDYKTKSNYFDYFHSSLLVSPDAKHFTSNGWVWSPYDQITIYSIEKFLQEFEMSHISIDFEPVDGYNWDRPLCWINNTTLGIGYNKKEGGESKADFPSEIVFVDILEKKIINRIEFNGFAFSDYGAVIGELFFDAEAEHFIAVNKQTGLLITNLNGNEIYKDEKLTSHKYSTRHQLFYQMEGKNQTIEIFELTNK